MAGSRSYPSLLQETQKAPFAPVVGGLNLEHGAWHRHPDQHNNAPSSVITSRAANRYYFKTDQWARGTYSLNEAAAVFLDSARPFCRRILTLLRAWITIAE
jgi:hypothetical protein